MGSQGLRSGAVERFDSLIEKVMVTAMKTTTKVCNNRPKRSGGQDKGDLFEAERIWEQGRCRVKILQSFLEHMLNPL